MRVVSCRKATAHWSWWVDTPPRRAPARVTLLYCHHPPPSPFDQSRRSSPFQHTPFGSINTESVLENWLWQRSKIWYSCIVLELYALVVWHLSGRRSPGHHSCCKAAANWNQGKTHCWFLGGLSQRFTKSEELQKWARVARTHSSWSLWKLKWFFQLCCILLRPITQLQQPRGLTMLCEIGTLVPLHVTGMWWWIH